MCAIICFVQFNGLENESDFYEKMEKFKAKEWKSLKEFSQNQNIFYIKQTKKKYLIVNHCHCAAFFVSFLGLTSGKRKLNWKGKNYRQNLEIIYRH
jgi:hypothetical protein